MKILLIFALAVRLCASKERVLCDELMMKYERGYLTMKERDEYCLTGCTFLNVRCVAYKEKTLRADIRFFQKLGHDFTNWVEKVLEGEASFEDAPLDYTDPYLLEAWMSLFEHVWTAFLCVIPILLNQWKYYNFWSAVLMIIGYLFLHTLGFMPYAIVIHNSLIAMLCLIHSANSSYLVESVWTLIGMVAVLFAMFIGDYTWQLTVLIASIIGFYAYIHSCFFVRRGGVNAGVAVAIAQLFVLIEQLEFVRKNMMLRSLGGAALEMCLNAIVPDGKSRFFTTNMSRLALVITKFLQIEEHQPIVFVGLLILQGIMFLSFRASLGAFYLYILRYKTDARSLAAGLYVYTIDAWGPLRCLFRIVFKYEQYNIRRAMYAIVGLCLEYYEMQHAWEFFVLRKVVSTVDVVFIHSIYGRTTHYLEYEVSFEQAAFPQKNALPWMSMESLHEICQHTKKLIAKHKDRTLGGMAVALESGGRAMLYTVAHVALNCEMFKFGDLTVSSPEFRKLTDGSDPMIAMKVELEDAPSVELLTQDEAFRVSHLAFVNESGGDKYVAIIPKFNILAGKLHAAVNLKKGDSGGPCFAVLDDGEIRLCGVVSQGNPRSGGGNIISFCYHSGELSVDSSDDESLGSVRQFNSVRRVRFASDNPDDDRYDAYKELEGMIEGETPLLERLKEWKTTIKWSDLTMSDDDLVSYLHNENYVENKRDEDDPDYDDDDGDKRKRSKKKDHRRRSKDKAFRKRAGGMARLLAMRLERIYSKNDSKVIFETLMSGNIPQLGPRSFINGTDGYNWVFSDSLPDADWS